MARIRRKKQDMEQRMKHYNAMDMNDKIIINFRDLNYIMRSLYEGKGSQRRILIILSETGCITQRELTQRLGIQPGSASEVIAKLENAGLIHRAPNAADRRTTDIHLTETGTVLAQEAVLQRKMRHKEMFSCLSEEEKQSLLSIMEKIYGDWEARYLERNEV